MFELFDEPYDWEDLCLVNKMLICLLITVIIIYAIPLLFSGIAVALLIVFIQKIYDLLRGA